VFRNVYYRKQTKNTYASTDPAFPYLLLFFQLLTSFAWSLAYADPSPANIVRIALTFSVVHCLLSCLVVATFMYVFVGRALGPGGWFVGIKRPSAFGRRRGLFGDVGNGGGTNGGAAGEEIEFGFCFDVGIGGRWGRGLHRSRRPANPSYHSRWQSAPSSPSGCTSTSSNSCCFRSSAQSGFLLRCCRIRYIY